MNIAQAYLKPEEKAVFLLRSLYRSFGYLPYKMSKFEEYDLYMRHKEFLKSDRIITFNDADGKLMALKPDVTLSIVKNGENQPGGKQKVCYNENVYRVSPSTHQFREILQTGLECIGDVDLYDLYEVLDLAVKSLAMLSEDFILSVSHVGILTGLFEDWQIPGKAQLDLVKCISEKNIHEMGPICDEFGLSDRAREVMMLLPTLDGELLPTLKVLEGYLEGETAKAAWGELYALANLFRGSEYENRVRLNLSLVDDMKYYNGLVFKGYLAGIWESVLSGGRYDTLPQRMGRKAGAVGFAVYMDLLENLPGRERESDVDVLLLYPDGADAAAVAAKVQELQAAGKTVSAQKTIPEKLRYKTLCRLEGEETV